MKHPDRRSFLATLGGAALAVTGCAQPRVAVASPTPDRRRLSRVGIQLYTVRRQATTDLAATLTQLAGIGYKEIEFWGSHSRTPAEIRQLLDQNGLTAPSVHVGLPGNPNLWDKILDDARVLGHRWITVPSLPSGPKATVDDWKRIAGQFNAAASRVQAAGCRFAFHNHNAEFRKIGDVVPFDVLIAETDPALVSFELDLHWVVAGDANPISYLQRFPKRFTMVHVKDSAGPPDYRQTDVGAGTIPFAKIFAAADTAGVQHFFVEADGPADPMAFAKNSFDYLATLEY